ncbi:MAG: 16S rRNA (guanine(527)-N(7))-methyltransferase RsmG [Deltaproteobacteria bacterium]|nr:16S rRNA (guanine(527)-N(7))-methyltransferase RsmG [Deltaproteobacteria bacterium]
MGIPLHSGQVGQLSAFADLMLKWNAKLNLTRITAPDEVRVKHLLDSLLGLRVLPAETRSVLDLGSGAGLPGIPWLIARPGLRVTLVDSVAKKVNFVKMALAQLRLTQGKAVHVHLAGEAEAEGLDPADVVVSRAFTSLAEVLPFARPYLRPNGAVVAMLGPREDEAEARKISTDHGFEVVELASAELPLAMGQRRVLRAVPRGTAG